MLFCFEWKKEMENELRTTFHQSATVTHDRVHLSHELGRRKHNFSITVALKYIL